MHVQSYNIVHSLLQQCAYNYYVHATCVCTCMCGLCVHVCVHECVCVVCLSHVYVYVPCTVIVCACMLVIRKV